MIPLELKTPQAIIASLGFSQAIVSLSSISQGTPGYPEAVGAQDTPNTLKPAGLVLCDPWSHFRVRLDGRL